MRTNMYFPGVLILTLALGFLVLCSNANSAPIAIVNHDFEDAGLADSALTGATPLGWTSNNSSDGSFNHGPGNATQAYGPGTHGLPGTIGTMDGPTFGFFSTASAATFSQVLGDTLEANTAYTLTAAFGRRILTDRDASPVTINLLAGGTVIATSSADPDDLGPRDNFADLSASIFIGAAHAELGQPLSIQLIKNVSGSPASVDYMHVDNVRLDALAAVPEPSSLLLCGLLSLAAYPFLRRRRSR